MKITKHKMAVSIINMPFKSASEKYTEYKITGN